MKARWLPLLFPCWLAGGCEDPTHVRIFLEADDQCLEDAQSLQVMVCDQDGDLVTNRTSRLFAPPEIDLADPFPFAPINNDPSRAFAFVAHLLDAQSNNISQVRLIGGYESGRRRDVVLSFDQSCLELPVCPGDQTCSMGRCIDARMWPGLSPGPFGPCSEGPTTASGLQTVGGEVVLAAEDTTSTFGPGGEQGHWFVDTVIEDFLGQGYMQSSAEHPADNSHLSFSAGSASLSYEIDFTDTGRYYVHLRTSSESSSDNGFFATVDGQEINYGGANPDDPTQVADLIYVPHQSPAQWTWYTDGGGAGVRGLRVSFEVSTPGLHTFTIHRRNAGSRVDHIWLTQDPGGPHDTGDLDLPDPATFLTFD